MPPSQTVLVAALCGLGLVMSQVPVPDVSSVPGAAVWAGIGMVAAGVITAFGNSIIVPWLKARGTDEKLADANARLDGALKRIKVLEDENSAARQAERTYLDRLAALADKNTTLVDKNTRLTDMNLQLTHTMLVSAGRQTPGLAPTSETFLISDDPVSPTGPVVLIVDDSDEAAGAVGKVLELRGCRVERVRDLPEGLEALDRLRPDYVILDLMLPSGDGVEILRRVRNTGLASLVIVTTGKSEERLGAVRALNPLAVFRKPFDLFAQLIPLVKETAP